MGILKIVSSYALEKFDTYSIANPMKSSRIKLLEKQFNDIFSSSLKTEKMNILFQTGFLPPPSLTGVFSWNPL